ncbi:hypothetical protein RV134_390129 [Roseovarius sp. EC-HK134]|nr:hypothetical protein RV420_460199 [Roseovarius sp. EC-SD190]VVT33524.1 hypothetical protein RV134_390129 [Roseovarius sp. EC-HK134]
MHRLHTPSANPRPSAPETASIECSTEKEGDPCTPVQDRPQGEGRQDRRNVNTSGERTPATKVTLPAFDPQAKHSLAAILA